MISSLYSGIQGIKTNAASLGVIGANIANVNTGGYKSGTVSFATVLGETQAQGGVKVWGLGKSWTQGALEYTSANTDLAIVGEGLFVVNDLAGDTHYSRAGAFLFDKDGLLVNHEGYRVQGLAIASGTAVGSPTDIDTSKSIYEPKATTVMEMVMNLDSATAASGTFSNTITVNDSLGTSVPLTLTFKKTGPGVWEVSGQLPSSIAAASGTSNVQFDGADTMTLSFGADGKITGVTADVAVTLKNMDAVASATQTISWDLYDSPNNKAFDDITQFSAGSSVTFQSHDGYATGRVTSVNVGEDGVITGVFSNGKSKALYQIVLANFPNYQGLTSVGNNLYDVSVDSGLPVVGTPKTGKRGAINSKSLEMSNVDLATEFVKMIVTQRAYQANAKVITTSNEVLQELINMKR